MRWLRKEDSPMARSARTKYRNAMRALEGTEVNVQEIGQLNKDGTISIDPEKLEELKKKLGAAAWRTVRFVALNAPFNRRSPTPPA
jgi:hypothetical protein